MVEHRDIKIAGGAALRHHILVIDTTSSKTSLAVSTVVQMEMHSNVVQYVSNRLIRFNVGKRIVVAIQNVLAKTIVEAIMIAPGTIT